MHQAKNSPFTATVLILLHVSEPPKMRRIPVPMVDTRRVYICVTRFHEEGNEAEAEDGLSLSLVSSFLVIIYWGPPFPTFLSSFWNDTVLFSYHKKIFDKTNMTYVLLPLGPLLE